MDKPRIITGEEICAVISSNSHTWPIAAPHQLILQDNVYTIRDSIDTYLNECGINTIVIPNTVHYVLSQMGRSHTVRQVILDHNVKGLWYRIPEKDRTMDALVWVTSTLQADEWVYFHNHWYIRTMTNTGGFHLSDVLGILLERSSLDCVKILDSLTKSAPHEFTFCPNNITDL